MAQNCWQIKKCGREVGGAKVKELGVCPAATERRLAGVHGGQNGGRACWVMTGTLCGGKVQGSYAAKLANCMACDFYKQVQKEDAGRIVASSKLFVMLK
ncbi:MAG: hypothetical protein IPK13_06110 [Deltaproteobacteria bacterium]|nr:hypothetical protein [Deltaproteobacteria bacterium]